jgi:hypothetical protein
MKIYGKLTVIVFILLVVILCMGTYSWRFGESFSNTLSEYDNENIKHINNKMDATYKKYNKFLSDYSNYLSTGR